MPPRIVSTKENKKPKVVETKEGEDFSLILQKTDGEKDAEPKREEAPPEVRGPDWAAKKREQATVDIEAIKNEIEQKRMGDSPAKRMRKWFDNVFK